MHSDLPSGTVTFLFTDVEGSTELMHQLGAEGYAAALAEHRRCPRGLRRRGRRRGGHAGRRVLRRLPTAPGAVAAAEAMTEALATGPSRSGSACTPVRRCSPTRATLATTSIARAIAAAAPRRPGARLAATGELVDSTLVDLGEHRLRTRGASGSSSSATATSRRSSDLEHEPAAPASRSSAEPMSCSSARLASR